MAVGVSTVNWANAALNVMRGTTWTGLSVFVKVHIGDPGSAGANNAAVGSTTRPAISWTAAASGTLTMTGTAPSWTNGGTSETLSHVSFWDAASAGNFLGSAALGSTQAWASANVYTLTAQGWSITPLAA
jgi:hypothetical protein